MPSLEEKVKTSFVSKNGRAELTKLPDSKLPGSDLAIELIATLEEKNGYYIGLYREKTEKNSKPPNYFLIEVKYDKIIPEKEPYEPTYALNSASTIITFETIEEAAEYIWKI